MVRANPILGHSIIVELDGSKLTPTFNKSKSPGSPNVSLEKKTGLWAWWFAFWFLGSGEPKIIFSRPNRAKEKWQKFDQKCKDPYDGIKDFK